MILIDGIDTSKTSFIPIHSMNMLICEQGKGPGNTVGWRMKSIQFPMLNHELTSILAIGAEFKRLKCENRIHWQG